MTVPQITLKKISKAMASTVATHSRRRGQNPWEASSKRFSRRSGGSNGDCSSKASEEEEERLVIAGLLETKPKERRGASAESLPEEEMVLQGWKGSPGLAAAKLDKNAATAKKRAAETEAISVDGAEAIGVDGAGKDQKKSNGLVGRR